MVLLGLPSIVSFAIAAPKPNIVLIVADDLGWADVGFNGARFYETPNIDSLAARGMIFSDAYPGASNCMPSRACIMSGAYITRTQMWTPGGEAKGKIGYMKLLVPRKGDDKGTSLFPSKLILEPSTISLAETLKPAGYQSIHLGKWHLGPDAQGFDINDTNGLGAGLDKKFYGNKEVAANLTDRAIRYVEENGDKPFFMYLCHWDVHTPIRAKEEVVRKYEEKLDRGDWDRAWNTTYAAMIEAVDTSVGRLYKAIEKNGLAENTLFIFTSDNGGHAPATPNDPLQGAKGAFYEGGIRVPMFALWPTAIKAGSRSKTPVTGVDYLPTFAEVAGAALPTKQAVDGRSIVSLMKGEDSLKNRSLFWHYPLYLAGNGYNLVRPVYGTTKLYWRATPCSVIRKGDWKLIQYFEDGSIELFNLRDDIGERRNLAKSLPEKAEDLLNELVQWQRDTNAVIPDQPNPDFSPESRSR